MAFLLDQVASQLIDAIALGSGVTTSAVHDFGDNTLIRGMWVYTDVIASGTVTTPKLATAKLVTRFCPKSATGAAMADNGAALIEWENPVSADQAYNFANYWDGIVPRFGVFKVQNLVGVDFAPSGISLHVEVIKETS